MGSEITEVAHPPLVLRLSQALNRCSCGSGMNHFGICPKGKDDRPIKAWQVLRIIST
jgi:hypothetical protein